MMSSALFFKVKTCELLITGYGLISIILIPYYIA